MNKVVLMGRLTKDAELRTTQSGISTCNFTVAVNRRFKNADGTYSADFISCVAWRQTAEFVCKYFRKGERIALSGSIQNRSYEDKDGIKHYVTEVLVDEVEFCESRRAPGSDANQDTPGDEAYEVAPGDDDVPF